MFWKWAPDRFSKMSPSHVFKVSPFSKVCKLPLQDIQNHEHWVHMIIISFKIILCTGLLKRDDLLNCLLKSTGHSMLKSTGHSMLKSTRVAVNEISYFGGHHHMLPSHWLATWVGFFFLGDFWRWIFFILRKWHSWFCLTCIWLFLT